MIRATSGIAFWIAVFGVLWWASTLPLPPSPPAKETPPDPITASEALKQCQQLLGEQPAPNSIETCTKNMAKKMQDDADNRRALEEVDDDSCHVLGGC